MVEILENHYTKQQVAKKIGELLSTRAGLIEMDADTSEVDVLLENWKERYDKLD